MRVIKAAEMTSGGEEGGPDRFSGQVSLHAVARVQQAPGVAVVRFENGARNHWHTHEGGQVLYVMSGRGRVQEEGGEVVELEAGDFVVAEPDEKHWHGAAPGTDMAHISVAGGAVEWFAPVED